MGHYAENLAKVKINKIHCSSLFLEASVLNIEGYYVGQR